ncbi:MAG TPA: Fur family transcriptional regulator [Gaiellaceae bacterium]|nr:Fur family transcriptional regulator [Gaiellaceae bacterium]
MAETVPGASPAELLRAHGLRVTAPRLAVLETLAELPSHVSVEQVEAGARKRLGTLSTQAVYDIMRALHDAGLVRRIEPAGSAALFETRVGDNHHHLVCRDCGRMVDVDCVVGEAPCLSPAAAAGFEVDEAEVIFWGRCPECLGPNVNPDNRAATRRRA